MVLENYAKAYKEMIEILKYTKKSDVKKIPEEKIILWKDNMDEKWNFSIDTTIALENQNILPETRAIIANIFYDYWATDYQRQRIDEKDKQISKLKEMQKREKNNPDNIFKKLNVETQGFENSTFIKETTMVEYKEKNFLQKIFDKIIHLFKKD